MKTLGVLICLASFPIAGYMLSYNNNLAHQPVIYQPQTVAAALVWLVMVMVGYSLASKGEKRN